MDHGFVAVGAEDHADGRVIVRHAQFAVVVVDVELHLDEILLRQLADLEINQDVALQSGVVEGQVDVEVVAVECQPLLPRHESESAPEFQQELPHMADECLLHAALNQLMPFWQVKKLQYAGILKNIDRALWLLAFLRKFHDSLLASALEQPLEEQAVDLAFEIGRGSAFASRFILVKQAGMDIPNAHEQAVVGLGEIRVERLQSR